MKNLHASRKTPNFVCIINKNIAYEEFEICKHVYVYRVVTFE